MNLLVVDRGNPLEEDLGLGRINIQVNPSAPCCQTLVKCHQTVHVFVIFLPILDVVEPAMKMERYVCVVDCIWRVLTLSLQDNFVSP